MEEDKKGKIEELNDTLYSRTSYKEEVGERSPVREVEANLVDEDWKSPDLDEMLKKERTPHTINPVMKKIFIAALVFFFATAGIATYVFIGGATFVSSRNVDIAVLGPTIVSAGETLELGVSVVNENNADLEEVKLSIQYPQGTRNADNTEESLTFVTEELGVVKSGSEVPKNIRAVFLGAVGETKELKFTVEYRVKGSNQTFYKEKFYEITIGTAPVSLDVSSPSSITSGGSFATNVSIGLNSNEILKNVVLKAEYPYGYSATDSTPSSSGENNVWLLGDLSPGDKKTVTIRGRLIGEDREQRTFRFYVGVLDSANSDPNPRIVLASNMNTVSITRPSLGLTISFRGESAPIYVAPAGAPVNVTVRYQNNLSERLLNPRLEVALSGSALDKFTVSPNNNGFYDSVNSRIVWEIGTASGARELNPGDSGQVTFSFSSLQASELGGGSQQDIGLNVSISGNPIGSVGGSPISVSESRTVRIASQMSLSSATYRTVGPFSNTGPMPPKAEEESTYTISLNAKNTRGDFSNAKVSARLGPSVVWKGASSATSESVVYEESSNTVTWNLGQLSSGTGFSADARQAYFQVGITPSIGQVGTSPTLVTNIVFTGTDTSTGETVTVTNPALTTRLVGDPAFIQGDDIVVR